MKTRKPQPTNPDKQGAAEVAAVVASDPASKSAAPALAAKIAMQLDEEIVKNEAPPKRFAGIFPSAQAQGRPEVSPAMRRIVETVFLADDEIDAAARRLVQDLSIGERRSDHAAVVAHLDRAEENARLAHRLMCTAKQQKERYDLDAAPIVSGMRDAANAELQAEKADNKRSKMITDADVECRCAEMFKDEWQSIRYEQRQLDLTAKHLEHQVENWASRCRTLQVIAGKLR